MAFKNRFCIIWSLPAVRLGFVLVHILHSLRRPSSFLCYLDHQQSGKVFRPWISAKHEELNTLGTERLGSKFTIYSLVSSLNYFEFIERNFQWPYVVLSIEGNAIHLNDKIVRLENTSINKSKLTSHMNELSSFVFISLVFTCFPRKGPNLEPFEITVFLQKMP